ncbi:MAG TPA: hypothetical protein DHM90_09555 [Clostridiaceae bacterium]|nr:hypothetical protein [Clostridiaceae bacterium]
MKYVWKTIWFIQALAARLIPMILFLVAHAIGEVYVYNWDPLQLLDFKQIPAMFDSYLFLYGALGLIIVILFFMNLPIIARVMTVGILGSQVLFFLQRWENYIYGTSEVDPYYNFYMRILISIIAGFILQVMWRLIKSGTRKLIYMMTVRNSSRKQSIKKVPVKK